jgi:hypothetical protein
VPGECYELVLIPARYETREERILAREAAEQIEIAPAESEGAEGPTTAGPETLATDLPDAVVIPAEYAWHEGEVLIAPAERVWKTGCSAPDLGRDAGESFCVVDEPARFETVRVQIVVESAESRLAAIAAATSDSAAAATPPARLKRVPIPARYQTISRKVKISGQRLEWRSVLCEQHLRPDTVREAQTALAREGFDPGPIDGKLGTRTHKALAAYQHSRELPSGALTKATLESLGVTMR